MGFFGKGSLSRSEPSWLDREKKKRGLLGAVTSEEATGKRRVERRELKFERAKKEKEAIERRLQAETATRHSSAAGSDHTLEQPSADNSSNCASSSSERFSLRKAKEAKLAESPHPAEKRTKEMMMEGVGHDKLLNDNKAVRFSPVVQETFFVPETNIISRPEPLIDGQEDLEKIALRNEEHLQLSNEETFFLVHGLGVLRVFDDTNHAFIPVSSLFALFRRHSYFPPLEISTPLEPDDPFVISYIVYHHFRSLGWVVRSGVKFGVDYLLYNRGPAFSHAEFAVVILSSYSHSFWRQSEERVQKSSQKQQRSWGWLHCVNRVQAQVKKSLVLCYVEVPPPLPLESQVLPEKDISAFLRRYKVREINVKRWVPNRSRD